MSLFNLEHSKTASRLDLAFFGAASVGFGVLVLLMNPRAGLIQSIAWAALGLASWTFIEYALHRFVLHGVKPFSTWHAEHHRRPAARIYSPTFVSVILIVALIYVPAWMAWGQRPACALTFGIVTGDFGYGLTHHAIHHWGAERGWIRRRKRWHGRHHAWLPALAGRPGYYGVTSPFWDYVFRTARGQRSNAQGVGQ
jgi:sterol desaturase/sphingolipid hydroxylase (fatty acid hydroxylase superfamily)